MQRRLQRKQPQQQGLTTNEEYKAPPAEVSPSFHFSQAWSSRSIPQEIATAYHAVSQNPESFLSRFLIGAFASVPYVYRGVYAQTYEYGKTYSELIKRDLLQFPDIQGALAIEDCYLGVPNPPSYPGAYCGFANGFNTFLPALAESEAYRRHQSALLTDRYVIPSVLLLASGYWGLRTVIHMQNQPRQMAEAPSHLKLSMEVKAQEPWSLAEAIVVHIEDSVSTLKDVAAVLPGAAWKHRKRIYFWTWVGTACYGGVPAAFAVLGLCYPRYYTQLGYRLFELSETKYEGCTFENRGLFGYEVDCNDPSMSGKIWHIADWVASSGYKIGHEFAYMMQYFPLATGLLGFARGVEDAVLQELPKYQAAKRQKKHPGRLQRTWNFVVKTYRSLCGARPEEEPPEVDQVTATAKVGKTVTEAPLSKSARKRRSRSHQVSKAKTSIPKEQTKDIIAVTSPKHQPAKVMVTAVGQSTPELDFAPGFFKKKKDPERSQAKLVVTTTRLEIPLSQEFIPPSMDVGLEVLHQLSQLTLTGARADFLRSAEILFPETPPLLAVPDPEQKGSFHVQAAPARALAVSQDGALDSLPAVAAADPLALVSTPAEIKLDRTSTSAQIALEQNPAHILMKIFEESIGLRLNEEDRQDLKKAVPALRKMVEEKPEDLCDALARNFTTGNAKQNFELMEQYGVFDALFPPVILTPDVKKELSNYFAQLDDGKVALRQPNMKEIYSEIFNWNMRSTQHDGSYDATYSLEQNIAYFMRHFPLLACQPEAIQAAIRAETATRMREHYPYLRQPQPDMYPQQPQSQVIYVLPQPFPVPGQPFSMYAPPLFPLAPMQQPYLPMEEYPTLMPISGPPLPTLPTHPYAPPQAYGAAFPHLYARQQPLPGQVQMPEGGYEPSRQFLAQ